MTTYNQGFINKCAEYGIDPYELIYFNKEAGIGKTIASVLAALGLLITPEGVMAGGCRGGTCGTVRSLSGGVPKHLGGGVPKSLGGAQLNYKPINKPVIKPTTNTVNKVTGK